MARIISTIFASLMLVAGAAEARQSLNELGQANQGKKIAVVSISANNFGNSLQGWNSADTKDLMAGRLNQMLDHTEQLLSKDWTVVKAATFAEKPDYQALAGEQRDVGLPKFGNSSMPLLSKDRKQLVKAAIDKDVAGKLAKVTGADYVLIIYSEWAVATGKFVPTSKALTKNVVSLFDANGKQVYNDRKDVVGERTLGGMGKVFVDAKSIDQWVDSYKEGINTLYGGGK